MAKENRLAPGNILLLCLSFWVTVMATRVVIFWSVMRGAIPAIFVAGYHIHHFITGFFLLVIALVLLSRKILSKYIPLALLGSSLGLVFDEFLFWTLRQFDYWSLINLTAVALVGTVMAISYVYAKKHDWAKKRESALHFKPEPRLIPALIPVVFGIIALIAMFSHNGLDAAYKKTENIQTISENQRTLP